MNILRILEQAIETMQTGMTICSMDGRILYTNNAEAAMHGWTVNELIGRDVRILSPKELWKPMSVSEFLALRSWIRESVNVRKDGTIFPVLLRSDIILNEAGAPIAVVTSSEDITERKKKQKMLDEYSKKLNDMIQNLEETVQQKTHLVRQKDMQLIEMDRIAGTAILAAGIAHEINNPLGFVNSSLSFLEKAMGRFIEAIDFWNDKPVPEPLMNDYRACLGRLNYEYVVSSLTKKFQMIKRGVNRITTIVNSLRSVSRVDQEPMGDMAVNRSIEDVIALIRARGDKDLNFLTDLTEVPFIYCHTGEIYQCLLHILVNAVDATSDGGTVCIATSYHAPENHVVIRIEDKGKGMSEDVLQKAFTPFFTTKPVGSGTGLGLSITENIIKRHGGRIEIESKEGEGTRVTLLLPLRHKEEQDK